MAHQSPQQLERWREQRDAAGPHAGVPWPALHGARSPHIVEPRAREVAEAFAAAHPELAAQFPEAVANLARWGAKVILYDEYHAREGVLDEKGNIRGGQHWFKAMQGFSAACRAFGLDPRSNVELLRLQAETAHIAADLASIQNRGAEALARRNGGGSNE